MDFNLSQLLQQGSVRDLVLNQLTKQFNLSNETGQNLLTKGLATVLGSMSQKATTPAGATGLFDLIKNFSGQSNLLDMFSGKAEFNASSLLDAGKQLLPSLLGDRAETVTNALANSTQTTPAVAKGALGMILPMVFGFFKNKIAGGLGLAGFSKLLADQTKAITANLDAKSLSALGLAGLSTNALPQQAKKSSALKWVVAGGVALAALFGLKSCNDQDTTTANQAVQTATAEPSIAQGLGNLAFNKTDNGLTLSGLVPDETTKANLLDAFKGLAGNLPLVDNLNVDSTLAKFGFNNFAGLADTLKSFPAVSGNFKDTVFNLVGSVASDDLKANLINQVQNVLGNQFSVNSDNLSVAAQQIAQGLGNLAFNKTDSNLTLSGLVPNEETKENILNAFKGLAGNLPLVDNLNVDNTLAQFGFNNFANLAEKLSAYPAISGAFADNVFNLSGEVADTMAKSNLVDGVKAVLGDAFSVNADNVTLAATNNNANSANDDAATIADMSADNLNLDIVFPTGSSVVQSRYYNRLNAFATYLIENNRSGEIAGYTDNVGNPQANQALSAKRANAVRDYLIKQGVPADKLTATGYGSANPIADNTSAEGRSQNRRIEFNAR